MKAIAIMLSATVIASGCVGATSEPAHGPNPNGHYFNVECHGRGALEECHEEAARVCGAAGWHAVETVDNSGAMVIRQAYGATVAKVERFSVLVECGNSSPVIAAPAPRRPTQVATPEASCAERAKARLADCADDPDCDADARERIVKKLRACNAGEPPVRVEPAGRPPSVAEPFPSAPPPPSVADPFPSK